MKNSKIQKSKSSKSNNSKELWFLCIALQLNEIYLPMKFNVDALHSFKVMFRTKKGRTDGQTDRQTDGRVNHYMPPFGGIKQLSTAFIVCYKFKKGGFDFHMHSSGEFL